MWEGTDTGAELLSGAAQYSLHKLTGSGSYFPPLRCDCPDCERQVTDRALADRPVHIEHGHAPGCPGLAAGQPASDVRASAGDPGK